MLWAELCPPKRDTYQYLRAYLEIRVQGKGVIKLKLGRALIQHDWCYYKKGNFGHKTQIHTEGSWCEHPGRIPCKNGGLGDAPTSLGTPGRAAEARKRPGRILPTGFRIPPSWHLAPDSQLPERWDIKPLLCKATQFVVLCRSSPKKLIHPLIRKWQE